MSMASASILSARAADDSPSAAAGLALLADPQFRAQRDASEPHATHRRAATTWTSSTRALVSGVTRRSGVGFQE